MTPIEILKTIYHGKVQPLEELYHFDQLHGPCLSDLDAAPMVLLLGQYSTGKTTLIERLIGRSYPGAHIGPEPTTDKWVAVMHGDEDGTIVPGNAAVVQSDRPFRALNRFGSSFLNKFQVGNGCSLD